MIQLIFFAVFLTGSLAQICGGNDKSVCIEYRKSTIVPHNETDPKFLECRFKVLPTGDKQYPNPGLQIHPYKDESRTFKKKQSLVCPTGGQLLMTESPSSEILNIFLGDDMARECCPARVIKECYYKVTSFFGCGDDGKTVDKHIKTEVIYENRLTEPKKSVYVSFFPEEGKVNCSSSPSAGNKKEELGKTGFYNGSISCGDDEDIDVRLYRFTTRYEPYNYATTALKAVRWQCGGQYVAMHKDPQGLEKMTMKTIVGGDAHRLLERRVTGGRTTLFWPVLAQTANGACGKIVKDVNLVWEEIFVR